MGSETDREKNASLDSAFLSVRAATQEDGPQLYCLLALANGFPVVQAPNDTPPMQNSLGLVVEDSAGKIDVALLGRYAVFAALTALADPTKLDAAALENFRVLVEQSELQLAKGRHIDCLLFMVPNAVAKVGEELRKLGFVSDSSIAIYWKSFRSDDAQDRS